MTHLVRRLLPAATLLTGLALTLSTGPAHAAQSAVGLGTADPFAVLAGTTVTNTGPSVVSGSLGVSAGSAVVGFPPGQVVNGSIHAADDVALRAQNDLTTAYNDAAGRGPVVDQTDKDLGGQTLTPGVYSASTGMGLTGTVTLDALGDPAAVFIFQAGSTLVTATSSRVALTGAAQACNVFWQVGSSATIGPSTTFAGTVMALTSISLQTGATVQGRMLARNGQVSLDTNTITRPSCADAPSSPGSSPSPSENSSPTSTPSGAASSGGSGGTADHGSDGPGNDTPVGGPAGPGSPGGPFIPEGHPETGRPDDGPTPSPAWLGLGLVCLTGAAVAARRAQKADSAQTSR